MLGSPFVPAVVSLCLTFTSCCILHCRRLLLHQTLQLLRVNRTVLNTQRQGVRQEATHAAAWTVCQLMLHASWQAPAHQVRVWVWLNQPTMLCQAAK
jgi:hypothetical protein